jgi:hypothetical protein
VLERGPDARAEQQQHGADRDVGEARHGDGEAGATEPRRQREPEHEQADEAAEPDRAGREVDPVERD